LHKPIHPLINPPPIDRTASHNTPIPILQLPQPQRLTDLPRALRARLILLIREDQQRRIPQLLLAQHRAQLLRRRPQPLDVRAVDDEHHRRRVAVVAAPVGPDGRLPTQVPDVEVEVLVRHGLDVEADRGNRGDDLADLEAVEERRFARVVEAEDQNADFLAAPEEGG